MAASSACITEVQVDRFTFPKSIKAPGSDKAFFLAGAGVRGVEIEGKFVKVTAIGVYLEDASAVIDHLSKWKGKTAEELMASDEFFMDVVSGPFERVQWTRLISPLTGLQYSEQVSRNCVAYWKSVGCYTYAEAKAVEEFLEVFKNETLSPGSSILYISSPKGTSTVSITKDEEVPTEVTAVIENKHLSQTILMLTICHKGISPETKRSIAARLSELLKD